MKSYQVIGLVLLSAQMLWAGLNTNSSTATMKVYEAGAEKLTVYTDVPGHEVSVINGYPSRARSDIYEIRVRSAATFSAATGSNEWVQCFANMTYNRGLEMPPSPPVANQTTHSQYYQNATKGWTHTYANIEMSTNSPVEVEIRKIGTTLLNSSNAIFKSAVHPAQKVSSHSNHLGRVYFTITNPCQIAIDINGQMDDHHYAVNPMPGKPPVHAIAFYANPIMTKPATTGPGIRLVTAGVFPPTDTNYTTMVFGPGIHIIGPGFKVHPGKRYYLPGDAILYGNMNNEDVPQGSYRSTGDRINIYGYGTICGIQIPHHSNRTDTNGLPNPEYPEWNALDPLVYDKDSTVGVRFLNAWDIQITGITTIDPANFNTKIDGKPGRTNDQSLVSWVKLHSWRVNGDGCGGYTKLEDSFIRASDDSTYVRDWRRRCTFWKDSNANIFRLIGGVSGGVEDCDIIYARWRDIRGVGNIFEFASYEGVEPGAVPLNIVIRNLRFHDRRPTPRHIINLGATQTFTGVKFEDIAFYLPLNDQLSVISGSSAAAYTGLMFTNITFQDGLDGSAPVKLTQGNYTSYFTVNEFVDPSVFEATGTPPVNLTVTNTVNGSITLNPPGCSYATGLVVTVTAVADSGYTFASWGGDLTGSVNPTTITMNGNKSVTATFIKDPNEIRLNCGGPAYTAQDGSVYAASSIGGAYTTTQPIDYTEDDTLYQSETYGATLNYNLPLPNGNYDVTLMFAEIAKNGPGQRLFDVTLEGTQVITNLDIFSKAGKKYAAYNETHNAAVRDGQLNIAFARTLDNAKISAIRVIPTHVVLSTSATNGWITLNPPPVGGVYPNGTVVTLTAMASNGYTFGSWSGDLAGSTNPATITMNGNQSVTANFSPAAETPPWGVNFNGLATGTTNQGFPTTWTATRGGPFQVSGDRLVVNGVGGEGVFTSGVINLSNRPVNLALDVLGAGGLDASGSSLDYIRLYIKVNGGNETLVHEVLGPQAAATWTTNGITGNTLQVVIRTLVTAATEYYYLDNLQVTNPPVTVPTYTLGTSATNGSITLNPPGGTYASGTIVTNTATPNPGYRFTGWGGSLSGSTNPAAIVMDGNKTVTATFALKPLVASIKAIGSGAGVEISASNLEPAWAYELQGKTLLTLPWDTVSGSLRSNVTMAVWTNLLSPTEPTKFFRIIKRD